ncbi:MAG: tryptophan-rich sensory protein, partial [Lysobacterales bacterium]
MSDVQSNSSWNQRLFAVLWIWISFRTILPWLVFFRLTFEGDSYSWGTSYFGHMFHSSGLARPDFLVIYALLAVSLFMLWQLRKQNFKLGGALLLLYLGFFALNALYQWMTGEPMIFEGDTLGVKVDLSTPFFLF